MKIIIDTREKQEWKFDFYKCQCISKKLDYGDYSIEGMENIILIERKKSVSEISINLGSKREQFFRELKSLSQVEYPYLICEFPREYIDMFPVNSGIPRKLWPKIRMNTGFILSSINQIENLGINIIFTSSKEEANIYAYKIMKEVYESKR